MELSSHQAPTFKKGDYVEYHSATHSAGKPEGGGRGAGAGVGSGVSAVFVFRHRLRNFLCALPAGERV